MSGVVNIVTGALINKRRDGQVAAGGSLPVYSSGIASASVPALTGSDILTKMIEVDGAGSELDADLLDGQHGSYYAPLASPTFTGTVTTPSIIINDLTNGYLPYKVIATGKLGNSPIFTDGTNVGIGTTTLDAPLTFPGANAIGRKISLYYNTNIHTGLGVDMGVGGYEYSIYCAAGPTYTEGKMTFGFVSHANPGTFTEKMRLTATGDLKQPSFTSGWLGTNWQIGSTGDAVFENLQVRGSARFRELIIDQLSVVGGSDLLSIARGKITSVDVAGSKVTLEDPNGRGTSAFAVGDFFWIKSIDIDNTVFSDCKGQISAITGVILTLDFTVTGHSGAITDINTGDVIVQRGHPTTVARQNLIYRTVSDTDNPFERTLTGVNSLAAFTNLDNVVLQTGNLASLASHGIVPATPGIGLYSQNVFLSGKIVASTGAIGGWNINSTYLAKDTGTDATSAGLAPLDYPFYAGKQYTSRASAPFRVSNAGVLTASSGTIGGWTIASTTLTGSNAVLSNTGVLTLGTGNDVAVMSSADTTYRLWAGNSIPGGAPFSVTKAGALTAKGVAEFGTALSTYDSISNVAIKGSDIWENSYNGDNSHLYINRLGYNGSTSYYRITSIGDGRGNDILTVDGNAGKVYVISLMSYGEIKLPNFNIAQRNTIYSVGAIIFNTETNQMEICKNGGIWSGITTH